jgi:hypothetical protein
VRRKRRTNAWFASEDGNGGFLFTRENVIFRTRMRPYDRHDRGQKQCRGASGQADHVQCGCQLSSAEGRRCAVSLIAVIGTALLRRRELIMPQPEGAQVLHQQFQIRHCAGLHDVGVGPELIGAHNIAALA